MEVGVGRGSWQLAKGLNLGGMGKRGKSFAFREVIRKPLTENEECRM